jgi:hypothetical protein
VGASPEYQSPQFLLEPPFPLLLRKLLAVHFLGPQIVFVIQERRFFLPFCLPVFAASFLWFAFRAGQVLRASFIQFPFRSIPVQFIFFVFSKPLQRLRP